MPFLNFSARPFKKLGLSFSLVLLLNLLLTTVWWPLPVKSNQASGNVTDCSRFGPDPGTLQDALESGSSLIIFSCSGTIIFPSTLNITTDITFDATNQDVTLSGNDLRTVFSVEVGIALTLKHITVANGNAGSVGGGGVLNRGILTLEDSTFLNNQASFPQSFGGGVVNQGTMVVSKSLFSANTASADGGGIWNAGTLEINDSTFFANKALNNLGGAISNLGILTITNSTFHNNTAYHGGAIMNYSVSPVNISNSTFSDNNALNGSAIYNYGNGIAVTKVFIVNSTFSSKFNTQGGIIYTGYATTTIKNTIVALYSTGSICAGDVLVDNGNNLQWPDTSCGNTITSSDPKLGPLADNGGPTQTRALLPGSPAINAGDNTTCVNPPVNNLDQRGNIRYSGGADCDIGAYEADNSILAAPSLSLAFNPASIVAGATTTLNLNLTNPNGQPLNNVSFTDNLPAQLKIANTNPTAINNCNNGTVSAPAGSGTISVSGVGLNPYQSCSITIKITSSSVGGWINTINSISSTETGTVTTSASANLSVTAPSPPTFTQGFNPPSIASGSISRLSFTLTNPNLVALTNASFSDTMPSQLQIANPSNLSNICGSGSVTATAGSSSISASGVNLAAGQTCTISLDVTSTTLGSWNNTTGPISATESGAGQPSNTATLRVFNQLIVTTTADDAATPPAGSLRQAVAEAGGQGGAIVSFDPALGTNPQINLVTPLLIPANVLIEASCTNRVRLNATFANSIQLSGGNYLQGLQIFSSVMPIIKARGGGNELKCTSANKV